jgi:nucleotide-binding universal stress UspA family protein
MNHVGAVVVGLGSEQAGIPELDWAAREAQARNRPLHIVRANQLTEAPLLPWATSFDRSVQDEMRRGAERRVAAALAHVAEKWPNVTAEGIVADEDAAAVLQTASAVAELTVLGSRHLKAFGSAVLGSVSTVVAAAANGPVVVVSGPQPNAAAPAEVVAGVDGSAATDDVLGFAFDYASRHGRPLRTLFCWRLDPLTEMEWRLAAPVPERAQRWLAEAVAGWQDKYPDVVVHRAIERDHPAAGLVAASHGQELLVVGAHSRHARIASLLGSVSQAVLHHATCPVAVIHAR